MKTRLLMIISISVTVFLMGTVVYPYINQTTFDDDYPHDIKTTLDNVSSIPEPRISGKMAQEICLITGGECPSNYPVNIQEDGSEMVIVTTWDVDTKTEKQFVFVIKNKTLSYEERVNGKLVSKPIPEPEPNPIPEEYNNEFVTKQDHYISSFEEEWIHEFQENYHTVITGKVIEWYGQKQPSKYDYQYRVEALAHHTPRMQEESIYKILGNEDNFIPVNADVVLFGLDNDDDGFLYIVKTVIQEKPEP